MTQVKKGFSVAQASAPSEESAGEFSAWLRSSRQVRKLRVLGADVPCGDCNACCRSSYFIHIRPEETRALARIDKWLLFPAPGLPKGNVLMGYDQTGKCPMLIDGNCSIYEDRPQTCRDYDCRVFAATGIDADEQGAQADIAERVHRWRFELSSDTARQELSAVRAAAVFLREHREAFPAGALPGNPVQLAGLAVQVYRIFCELEKASAAGKSVPPAAEIANAVLAQMDLQVAPPRSAVSGRRTP